MISEGGDDTRAWIQAARVIVSLLTKAIIKQDTILSDREQVTERTHVEYFQQHRVGREGFIAFCELVLL